MMNVFDGMTELAILTMLTFVLIGDGRYDYFSCGDLRNVSTRKRSLQAYKKSVSLAPQGYKGCIAQDDLLDGPTADQAVLNGTEHTLECSIRPGETVANVVWSEVLPGGTSNTIYFGSNFGGNPEYADFILDTDNDRKWNLHITSVGIDDEGMYGCSNSGSSELDVAVRRVEVRSSSLQMTQDGKDTSPVTMRAGEPLDIVCTVVGARPTVEVWWYDQEPGESEQRVMEGVTQIDTDNGDGTFDSVNTLQYTATKDYNRGSLRCETTGQEVAQSRQDSATLSVQYEPDVTVSWNDPIVFCSSDANPEAVDSNDYVIIVNGIDAYTPEFKDGSSRMQLNIEENTHIRCNVTNSIGMGTADTIAVPGTPPTPTNTGTPKPPDVDLTFNLSTLCTPNPPSDDADIVITVDGIPVAMDSEITLPSSGCITVECTVMKDSLTNSRTSDVCTNVQLTSGAPVAAVAVPLALITAASIAFAIAVIFWARRSIKGQPDKDQIQFKRQNPPQPVTAAGPNAPQTYMELNTKTREKEQAYEEPQPCSPGAQSPTYEDIAEDVGSKDRVYQELGDNSNKDEQLKEYVNVKPTTKARQTRRK